VTGDGSSTIRQLTDGLNVGRGENPMTSNGLVPVKIDEILRRHLAKRGYDLDSVPPPGKRIALRANSNLSTGGIAIDVTDSVHPELRAMAEQLALSIGLYTAGLDYITTDISASPWEIRGAFIEINSTPGLDICVVAGRPADKTIEMIFGNTVGRIPARLFISDDHAVNPDDGAPAPDDPAIVSGNRLRIGNCTYKIARTDEWNAVQAALRNRKVQSLDIYTSRQEVLSRGLPLDRFDKIVVNDPDFPDDWRPVLQRCAGEIEIVGELQPFAG
jgi:cyanophycin synthetase